MRRVMKTMETGADNDDQVRIGGCSVPARARAFTLIELFDPGPSKLFVFLDMREESIDMGNFATATRRIGWSRRTTRISPGFNTGAPGRNEGLALLVIVLHLSPTLGILSRNLRGIFTLTVSVILSKDLETSPAMHE
jgi:hypothetical protein